MEIKFFSNKTEILGHHNVKDFEERKAIIKSLFETAKTKHEKCIAIDSEFSDLDYYKAELLLTSMGNEEVCVVIDNTSVNLAELMPDDYREYRFVGHNVKIDQQMLKHAGLELLIFYDTMIAEQKITQNSGFPNNLNDVVFRYFKEYPKDDPEYAVKHFVGKLAETYIPLLSDIEYAANDILYVLPLMYKQKEYLKRYKLEWFVYNVEFPLIEVLSDMELEGVCIHAERVKSYSRKLEKELHELQVKMDEEVQQLTDQVLFEEEKPALRGGKHTAKRNEQPIILQTDLFGETVFTGRAKSDRNVNYNSTLQITQIFAKLKQPMPTKLGFYLIPFYEEELVEKTVKGETIHKKQLRLQPRKGRLIDEDGYTTVVMHTGFTVDSDILTKFIVDCPNSPMLNFVEMIIRHGQLCKSIDNYGYPMLKKINKHTGNLHTRYRQASTANGRLSSGDSRRDPDKPNLQNLPRDNALRNCFIPDYTGENVFLTCDYTGAEVVIMCDKSNDRQLYEWAVVQDDAHSPIITNSWRYIFLYRAGEKARVWSNYKEFLYKVRKYERRGFDSDDIEVLNNYHLFKTFTVNKQTNPEYRQSGKNCTFGSVYGMKPKKAAETYNGTTLELRKKNPLARPVNVTVEEGKVALWAIKQSIPATFEYIEETVQKAFSQGYLILNERSYSRVWFRDVLLMLQAIYSTIRELEEKGHTGVKIASIKDGKYVLTSNDEFELGSATKEVDGQARNLTISGTQADFIKEAMVVIHRLIKKYQLPFRIILQVHDELVVRIPKTVLGTTLPKIQDTETGIFRDPMPIEEFIPSVMKEVANRYLVNVKIGVDWNVKEMYSK